jgi:predicted protein tyrosine phosphatase
MIKHITHAGVLHVNDIIDNSNPTRNLLISILDYHAIHDRPDFSRFHKVLSLCFKDRCEEDYGIDDLWPDEPDDVLSFRYTGHVNEKLFSLSDAQLIVDFVEKYHGEPEEYNLIAHCKSGVGRSAAIAEFFGITHNIPYKGTDPRGRFMPNCRVSRLLTKAYFNKYKHVNNGNHNTEVQQLDLSKRCYLTS